MYPTNVTQLAALLTAVAPFLVAAIAGLVSSRSAAAKARLTQWRRLNELAKTLYNKDHASGAWAQIAAAHELGEVARPQRAAAALILLSASEYFGSNLLVKRAVDQSLAKLRRRRRWLGG